MKRVLSLLALFLTTTLWASAQINIQTHYDFGKTRKMFTTTVEMFKPENFGSTYFFIDMDYGGQDFKGVSLAYMELMQSFKVFKNLPIEPRAEYNGGLSVVPDNDEDGYDVTAINHAFLFGAQYTIHSKDFSKIFTLQANYKWIQQKNNASFQITAVWALNYLKNHITLSGFADIWRENNIVFGDNGEVIDRKYIFITEPQFWYNFNKHVSLGTEIEMSVNFATNKGFMINPTAAAKWTF